MQDYLFKHILYLLKEYCNEINKNKMLNQLEEYIEWCNYSEIRFKKDYTYYKKFFQNIQVHILLNEYIEADNIISDELISIDLRANEEDLA